MYSFPTYAIVNRNSGKNLALPKQSTASDLQVQQSTFTQAGYQQWMIRPVGGGVYSICNWGSSAGGGLCLGVRGASTASGAAVVQQALHRGREPAVDDLAGELSCAPRRR